MKKYKSITIKALIFIYLISLNAESIKAEKKQEEKVFGPWNSSLIQRKKKKEQALKTFSSASSFFFTGFIRFFQIFLSPQDGPNCRYSPTCSRYAQLSINKFGPIMGTIMFADRYMRCNPFGAWGDDYPEDNYFFDNDHKQK